MSNSVFARLKEALNKPVGDPKGTKVKHVRAYGGDESWLNRWLIRNTAFDGEARVDLYQNIIGDQEAKVKLRESLEDEIKIATSDGRKPNVPLARILQGCLNAISGDVTKASPLPLSRGLRPWIPISEAATIAAGEESGDLITALSRAIALIRAQQKIGALVREALVKPIGYSMASIAILVFIGFGIAPDMLSDRPLDQWNGATYLMLLIAVFVKHFIWLIIPALMAAASWVWWSLDNFTGPSRLRLERFPPWNIYRQIKGVEWMLQTATLLAANVSIKRILEDQAKVATKYLRKRLSDISKILRRGQRLGTALKGAENDFPEPKVIHQILRIQDKGDFDKALVGISERMLDRSISRVSSMSKRVNSIFTLILYALVALLYLGILGMNQAADTWSH